MCKVFFKPEKKLAHVNVDFRISVTIISRLILNLHAYDDKRCGRDQSTSRYLSWVVRAADDFTMQSDRVHSSNMETRPVSSE